MHTEDMFRASGNVQASGELGPGLGARLTARQEVQCVPVTQPAMVLQAPRRFYNSRNFDPLYESGRQDRYPLQNLAAPARTQSIPGYVVTQNLVLMSQPNSTLAYASIGVRAPRRNEAWDQTACAPVDERPFR